jgi:hypothetical protein
MLLVLVGSGWMRHGYQGGLRDPVGIVKGHSSDRPLRGRRRGHTGIVSTRLPLQTRPFGRSRLQARFIRSVCHYGRVVGDPTPLLSCYKPGREAAAKTALGTSPSTRLWACLPPG